MSEPLQKGSVLDALILMHIQEGEDGASTAICWTVKCIKGEKLVTLGTVNSTARKKYSFCSWCGVQRKDVCEL